MVKEVRLCGCNGGHAVRATLPSCYPRRLGSEIIIRESYLYPKPLVQCIVLLLTSTSLQQTISRVRSDWKDGAAPTTAKQECQVIVAYANSGGFASWLGRRASYDTNTGEVATDEELLTLLVRASRATCN